MAARDFGPVMVEPDSAGLAQLVEPGPWIRGLAGLARGPVTRISSNWISSTGPRTGVRLP